MRRREAAFGAEQTDQLLRIARPVAAVVLDDPREAVIAICHLASPLYRSAIRCCISKRPVRASTHARSHWNAAASICNLQLQCIVPSARWAGALGLKPAAPDTKATDLACISPRRRAW